VLDLVLGAAGRGNSEMFGSQNFWLIERSRSFRDRLTFTIFAVTLVLVAYCTPQIPQELHCICTWVSLKSWQLISWTMTWPGYILQFKV